jgi:hypothetical protein
VVMLAGFALIGVGGLCLYLSYAVARTSSWSQGTLDAFGVGFVVGGVVDVLAISGLNSVVTGEQKLRQNNLVAELILESPGDPGGKAETARQHLALCEGQLDLRLRRQLEGLVTGSVALEQAESE